MLKAAPPLAILAAASTEVAVSGAPAAIAAIDTNRNGTKWKADLRIGLFPEFRCLAMAVKHQVSALSAAEVIPEYVPSAHADLI